MFENKFKMRIHKISNPIVSGLNLMMQLTALGSGLLNGRGHCVQGFEAIGISHALDGIRAGS